METVKTFKQSCINLDLQDRTLKFRLQGPGAHFITRTTFLNSLDSQGAYDVERMWKGEDNLEYFVAFNSIESVKYLKEVSVFPVYKDVKAVVTNANEIIQFVRFYWVPLYVSNECFVDYLEAKNLKVITQEVVKDEHNLPSGIRQFKVLGIKKDVISLPHLVDFSLYQFQSLLKVQGRDPMCLRCRQIGHLRNQCPELHESRARRAEMERRNQNLQKRGWEVPRPADSKKGDVSTDSDSEKGSGNEDPEISMNTVRNSVENEEDKEDNDKTLTENDIKDTQEPVEAQKIDKKNENEKSDDRNQVSDKGNEHSDDDNDTDLSVLMNEDDTIASTQESSFSDKHSNLASTRSKRKRKKKPDN